MRLLTLCAAIGLCASIAQSQTTFGLQQAITYDANNVPGMYAADLDGDGDIEALSASQLDGKVAWYANTGAGVFGPQQIISSNGHAPVHIHAADLDGDGDLDVICALRDADRVAWYQQLGVNSGTFGPEQAISNMADNIHGVFAADINGDGLMDVLSASYYDDKLAWYPSLGSGSFGAQQVITTSLNGASQVYAADLDQDGDQDVLGCGINNVSWYENLGAGSFGLGRIIDGSSPANGFANIMTADLDGDSDFDVLFSDQSGRVAWHENTGNATDLFGSQHIISPYQGIFHYAGCYAGDLDNDGDIDVLRTGYDEAKISWFINAGYGAFGSEQIIDAGTGKFGEILAADLDNDGDNDIMVGGGTTSSASLNLAWYENLAPTACNRPENLGSTLLDATTVRLQWDVVPGAIGYRLRGRSMGGAFEKVLASPINEKMITGFTAGTVYEWSVRAACVRDSSPYAPLASFVIPMKQASEALAFHFYPNPVQEELILNGWGKVQWMDGTGRLLTEFDIAGTKTVDVSDYGSGIYFLRWLSDGNIITKQVIID